MTEPVIDIRDRIEKMRNQMTVPASKASALEKKNEIPKVEPDSGDKPANVNIENLEKKIDQNQIEESNKENIELKKKENPELNSEAKNFKAKKVEEQNFTEKIEFEKKKNFRAKQNFKTYDSYQNDRVVDEKKQSVKLEENQPFPQFSLNVSNPISWKLMLLIMLMQLLTNMMLVVVLYLK